MSSARRPSKADVVADFRRGQILEAARQSFATLGVTRTTIDAIARRAKLAKGTVYLYYRSKDELLQHILEQDLARLRDETVPLIEGAGGVEEKLTRFIAVALAICERKRDFFQHADAEMTAEIRKKAKQRVEQVFREQIDAWRTTLEKAARAGVVRKDADFAGAAQSIVALANGLARQQLLGWKLGSIDAAAAEAAAILWKGLAAS